MISTKTTGKKPLAATLTIFISWVTDDPSEDDAERLSKTINPKKVLHVELVDQTVAEDVLRRKPKILQFGVDREKRVLRAYFDHGLHIPLLMRIFRPDEQAPSQSIDHIVLSSITAIGKLPATERASAAKEVREALRAEYPK